MRLTVSMLTVLTAALVFTGPAAAFESHEGDGGWQFLTPEILAQADANHNGSVTFQELHALFPLVGEMLFHELDRNNDGVITPDDLPPPPGDEEGGGLDPLEHLLYFLNNADADENGEVTFDEVLALFPNFPADVFLVLDHNDDNVLTPADLPPPPLPGPIERLLRLLQAADANGDGEVTFEELAALEPGITQEQFDQMDRNDDGVLSHEDLPPPPLDDIVRRLLHILNAADANGDGEVTPEEFHALLPDAPHEAFERLDRNHDGVLSQEDLPPPPDYNPIERLLHLLREADANEDGQVTLEEVRALLPDFPQELFDRLDFNDDGVLSHQDLPPPPIDDPLARLLQLLHRADADQNGEVTLAEIQAVVPEFTQEAFDRLDHNDDGVISRADLPHDPPLGPCERLAQLLREADADNNGEVTFEELQSHAPDVTLEQFNRLDRNGDSVLSRDDLPPFPCDGREAFLRLLRHADADENGEVTFEELAQVIPDLTQERFDRLDQNGDGVLTPADLPEPPVDPLARLIRLLHDADANDDGQVTFEELAAVAPNLTQEQFDHLDRNDDGLITAADLPERLPHPREFLRALLQEADTDENGEVTLEELQALRPEMTQEQFDQLDRNDDGVLSIEDAPEGPIPPLNELRLRFLRALFHADTNQDGVLDASEIAEAFPDAPAELIASIDTNGDWVITREEIRAAFGQSEGGEELVESEDVDGDGETNAVDVQNVINHALALLSELLPADIDGDDAVDALDVQLAINGALSL